MSGRQNKFKEKLETIKGDKEKLDVLVRHIFFSHDEEVNERMSELLFYFFLAHGGELEKELESIDEIRELMKIAESKISKNPMMPSPIWIDPISTVGQPNTYPQWGTTTDITKNLGIYNGPISGNSFSASDFYATGNLITNTVDDVTVDLDDEE